MKQPNLPLFSLRLGIVGNRDLNGVDLAQLQQTLQTCLAQLQHSMTQLHSEAVAAGYCSDAPAQVFLLNALAEGADQLVAQAATAVGGFQLRCPIPFSQEQYQQGLEPAAQAEFSKLLAEPTLAARTLELCGAYEQPAHWQQGFRVSADWILEQCDLLLAVYDPGKSGSIGGSLESVQRALQQQIPVLQLALTQPDTLVLQLASANATGGTGEPLTPERLDSLLRGMLFPAKDKVSESLTRLRQEPLLNPTQRCRYFGSRALYYAYASAWQGLQRLAHVGSTTPAATTAQCVAPNTPWQAQQTTFDTLAKHYMGLYRGSFIWNFILGALAVSLAVLSQQSPLKWWTWAELISLISVVLTYYLSRKAAWQQRAVDYRFLAEYFRHAGMLSLLGRKLPMLRPAIHAQHDPQQSWLGWYLNAEQRALDPIPLSATAQSTVLRLDAAQVDTLQSYLCQYWLQPQQQYHRTLHSRYAAWEHRAHRIMAVFFGLTLLAVLAHLTHWPPLGDAGEAVIMFIVTALPAWLAAIHGITVQGEFARLAERSELLAHYLQSTTQQLGNLSAANSPHYANAVGDLAAQAARTLLQETIDWQVLYRGHEVELT